MWFRTKGGVLRRLGRPLMGVNAIELGRPVPASEAELSSATPPSSTTQCNTFGRRPEPDRPPR